MISLPRPVLSIFLLALVGAVTLAGTATDAQAAQPVNPLQSQRILFGFNDDFIEHYSPSDFDLVTGAGAEVIRGPMGWIEVQPHSPEQWSWKRFDNFMAPAQAAGLRVIFAPAMAPCWARPSLGPCKDDAAYRPDAEFLDEYQTFVRAVIERYPQTIVAVEAGNEQNAYPFWGPGPEPELYTAYLRATYEATKSSARPDLPVLYGGLQPAENGIAGVRMKWSRFLLATYRLGAGDYFDAMSFHLYPDSNGPAPASEAMALLARLERLMNRHGDRSKPVWITETGISSAAISDRAQAERTRRLVTRLVSDRRVRAVLIHRLFGSSGDPYGITGLALVPKQAWCELALMRFGTAPAPCVTLPAR